MSNTLESTEQACDGQNHPCGGIDLLLTPKDRDLGGFSVRRLLPTARRKMVGPWIFFDHMGPARFAPGTGVNVRPHPHIGLATVTYLFEGEILHRDSLGSLQPVRPGDVNLMVAGRGIVHSERERPEVTATEHALDGLQLWLALPEDQERCEPAFHHIPAEKMPASDINGVAVRVMIGSAWGLTSPVPVFSDTLYAEARLQPGQSLPLPESPELALYVVRGTLTFDDTELAEHTLAIFEPGSRGTVTATTDTQIALVGGAPLGKRFIDWNFVASDRDLIRQARNDWQAGRFPKVPGDESEFIPLSGD